MRISGLPAHFRFAKLFSDSARRYRGRDAQAEGQPTFSDEFVNPAGP